MKALFAIVLMVVAMCCISCTKNVKDYTLCEIGGPDSVALREKIKNELTAGDYTLLMQAGMRHAFANDTAYKDMKLKDLIAEQEKINKEKGE